MHAPISPLTIQAIAEAIFYQSITDQNFPTVIEGASEFSEKPRILNSVEEFTAHAEALRATTKSSFYFAVYYPDMAGKLIRKKIKLNPDQCDGHSFRYDAEGWGLIWLRLELHSGLLKSSISANTEKRALQWANTYRSLGSPSEWNWKEVGRHLRRLQRVLKENI